MRTPTLLFALIPMLMHCTQEKGTKRIELSCDWVVAESYPEQLYGTCSMDTDKTDLPIPLAENFKAVADSLTFVLNDQNLAAEQWSYDADKNTATLKNLANEQRKGTLKVHYTALHP